MGKKHELKENKNRLGKKKYLGTVPTGRDGHDFDFKIKIMILRSKS